MDDNGIKPLNGYVRGGIQYQENKENLNNADYYNRNLGNERNSFNPTSYNSAEDNSSKIANPQPDQPKKVSIIKIAGLAIILILIIYYVFSAVYINNPDRIKKLEDSWSDLDLLTNQSTYRAIYYINDDEEYENAISDAKKALDFAEKKLGRYHAHTATSSDKLAFLYEFHRDYTESEKYYAKSLSIREKAFGTDSTEILDSLDNLAKIYEKVGKSEEADNLYKRIYDIAEKNIGYKSTILIIPLKRIAASSSPEEAEKIYLRILGIYENNDGLESTRVASSLMELGDFYKANNNYTEAEKHYNRSLMIYEKQDMFRYATVLQRIAANIIKESGYNRSAEIEQLYLQALTIVENESGQDSLDLKFVLMRLKNFYNAIGNESEANKYQQRLEQIERLCPSGRAINGICQS